MSLLTIDEPAAPVHHAPWSAQHPVWALGFRPFYILTAAFAALAVPLWLAQYLGWITLPHGGLGWHAHEMVYGMAIAVIIGFLFTAGRNWTNLPTPHGAHLAALACVWLAGRAAMLCAPPLAAAVVDLLFVPLAAWPLYRVLKQSGNKRNLFLVALLGLLTMANALFHAATLGWIAVSPLTPVHGAILVIVIIEAVIGGRVIPMFTSNGAPGTKPVVRPRYDKVALCLTAAASIAWVLALPGALTAALMMSAACAMMLRLAGWQPQRTLHVPLLWILHLGYAWIAFGFAMLSLAALGIGAASTGFHALAVGSMAGLIIGMMTRTTLGHTGRVLKAGRWEPVMYFLVQGGAVLRMLAQFVPADWRAAALVASGACWSLSFALFLLVYTPYLWRARIDGREG
ncbi:NnrS family protein [Massilia antarctica]|uniref:NnrS family protein n=1 Tax=Massilia antarctica TaxID=2765360 RepID=A0AA49A7G2_9BURK|nr:NnrS family protein [Massilia antarctica]QPI48767.1 NnrS family protein [Massilia antarctica]